MLPIDLQSLPSSKELPCSDDTPVDDIGRRPSRSEEQNLLSNVLLFLLNSLWADRLDWDFGVDMVAYHKTGVSPGVPVVLEEGTPRRTIARAR